jgi:hypothetical protein
MTGKKIREGIFKFCKEKGIPHFNSTTPSSRGEPDTKYLLKGGLRKAAVWVYIEIKGDGDRLSPHQKDRITLYRSYGQPTYVVQSIKEGTDILEWYLTHKTPYPHYLKDSEK